METLRKRVTQLENFFCAPQSNDAISVTIQLKRVSNKMNELTKNMNELIKEKGYKQIRIILENPPNIRHQSSQVRLKTISATSFVMVPIRLLTIQRMIRSMC